MSDDSERDFDRERRRYFRVDDVVEMQVQSIKPEDLDMALEQFDNRRESYCLINSLVHEKEIYLPERRALEKKYPEVARYLKGIESRLDILAKVVTSNMDEREELPKQKVNISAQGIRFLSAEHFEVEGLVELKLVLFPSCQRVLVIGSVVWCIEDPGAVNANEAYAAAVDFTYINEADREVLIKHVHSKQIQEIHD